MVKPVYVAPDQVAVPAKTTPIAPIKATTVPPAIGTPETAYSTLSGATGIDPSVIREINRTVLHLMAFAVSDSTKASSLINLRREFAVVAAQKLPEQQVYDLLYGQVFGVNADKVVATMLTNLAVPGAAAQTAAQLSSKLRNFYSEMAFKLATGADYTDLLAAL